MNYATVLANIPEVPSQQAECLLDWALLTLICTIILFLALLMIGAIGMAICDFISRVRHKEYNTKSPKHWLKR